MYPIGSSANISHCKAAVETYYQYHGNKEKSLSLAHRQIRTTKERENFGYNKYMIIVFANENPI